MKALKSAFASFIATIVLSASGIALAADGDAVENADNSVIITDIADNITNTVEDNSDASDDSLPSEDVTSDTDSEFIWDECSISDDGTTQRCKGEEVGGNPVAKSSIELPEKTDPSPTPQTVAPTTRAQSQNSRPVALPQNTQALSRPVTGTGTGTGVNLPVTFVKDSDDEKPKLPRTCGVTKATATSAKPVAKKCGQNSVVATNAANVDTVADVASAVLVTDTALVTASSRASLFTLVTCAAFALVGAGSVVSVRRLQH